MKTKEQTKINFKKIRPLTYVTVERHQKLAALHGAFLRDSKNWVLIQNIEDFRIDGYSLIHKILIKNIRQGAGEKVYQEILTKEGLDKKVKAIKKMEIDDVFLSLAFLKALNSPVIIECELIGTWPFSLGYIEELRQNDFDLRYFNSKGKLDSKPRRIKYAHIDRIGFKERYGEIFGKYVKK